MNRSELLNHFEALFAVQKRELLSQGGYGSEELHMAREELLDETDLTQFDREQEMRIRLKSRESLLLKKIDEALITIHEGTFGLCKDCEEEIEFKRLQARPTATLCLSCKEAAEHSEHRHAEGLESKSALAVGRRFTLIA